MWGEREGLQGRGGGPCFSLLWAGLVPMTLVGDGDILTAGGPQRNWVPVCLLTCPEADAEAGVGIIAVGLLGG